MSIADIFAALRRRWYVLVPGLIIALAAAGGAWLFVKPTYERVATQMLLPGESTVPADSNPYLYIGGLGQAADIVVRAVGSENVLGPILEAHPGTEATITRDPSTSGPVFLITVGAPTDTDAETVVKAIVAETATVLDAIQDAQDISRADRIKVAPIFIDEHSTLQQKQRLTVAAIAGAGLFAVTLVVTVLVDGLILSRTRRGRPSRD